MKKPSSGVRTNPSLVPAKPKAKDRVIPVEKAPSFGDLTDDPMAAVARLAPFRGLTREEQTRLAKAAKVVRIPQDRIVPRADGTEEAAFCFVCRGQVAFAEFPKGSLPKGPPNPKKRVQPMMQLTKKNLALFDEGDFFTNEHVAEAKDESGKKDDVALYTLVNVVLLKIPKKEMQAVLKALPAVKEAVEARAEAAYYRQTFLKVDSRSEVFDFYLKQGFEYAQAIKVIQADKCIDCDECVRGCEDRHGISRIERFGPRVGMIQFTDNCRTCYDARCIDPCNFDAIGYDQGEVIVYDNCVGCTLCAKSCPHDAIRMVDVPEPQVDLVQLAKQKEGRPMTVVAEGEEAPGGKGKKKPKRIANKCDHCFGYSDLACISACPTGAIIQIDPRALFRRDGGLIERAERYFDPAPFEQGYSEATRTQGVTLMRTLFGLATLGVLFSMFEFYARRFSPGLSAVRFLTELLRGPAAARALVLTWNPTFGIGRLMGYLGAGMMTVAALYTARLHLPGLRRVGSSKTWFDFHVVFGTVGPIFALLHTSFNVFQLYWVAYLFWAVMLVLASGLIGRFIYTALPRVEVSAEKDKKALDEGIQDAADQWGSMTISANVLQQFVKAQSKKEANRQPTQVISPVAFMGVVMGAFVRRLFASISLRFQLLGDMRNAQLRQAAIKLMTRRAALDERMRFIGVARRLLAQWRSLHIALSIVMFLMLIAHVAISIWATGL